MGLSWSSESRKFHQFNSFSLILLHNVHNMLSHPKSALLTEGISQWRRQSATTVFFTGIGDQLVFLLIKHELQNHRKTLTDFIPLLKACVKQVRAETTHL